MPAMIPAYFQASRWLRGYMAPPTYGGGYNAQRAQAYVDGILNGLTDPNRPGPPGPALTRVRKMGVDAANPRNLTWIQAAWLQGQPAVLQQACGLPGPNNDQAGVNTGRASYAIFQHAFSQLFAQDADFTQAAVQAAPLFSIIDTDSAHHLSAPLVERAVLRAAAAAAAAAAPAPVPPAARTIVINFDAHEDYGGAATLPNINCQSWGYFVTNPVANVHAAPLADAYVQFGSRVPMAAVASWAAGKWHQAAGPAGMAAIPYAAGAASPLRAQLDAVLAAVAAVAPGAPAPPVQAYVSLDRDVLRPHYNQYPDGPFQVAQGLAGVMDCLTHLHGRGVLLIGFDVTGLPVVPSSSTDAAMTVAQALADAQSQITQLWTHVLPLL
jgi:hypothetical protein